MPQKSIETLSKSRVPIGLVAGEGFARTRWICYAPAVAFGGLFDKGCHSCGLRHVDRMAAFNPDDCKARPLGHGALGGWRNHPVLDDDQIPARLGLPCWFADCTAESLHAPRDLGVGHDRSFLRLHVGRERGGELSLVEEQKPSCGGRIGGTGAPGGGSLMSVATDSPLSGANAVIYTSPATFGSLLQ